MNRRSFVAVFVALGVAPPAVQAQPAFRVGVLIHGTERTYGTRVEALRAALRDLGYVEGRNLALSVRWNEGAAERLPDLAAELLREKPDVLVAAPVFSAAAAHRNRQLVKLAQLPANAVNNGADSP